MDKHYPKTPDDLRSMLHKGMGRAVLYLRDQDLHQYRDLILDCCLHNYAYDMQFEQNRAEYLYQLIKDSDDEGFYRRSVLDVLPATYDCDDAEQLLDLAVLFARDGDDSARDAVYTRMATHIADQDMPGADQAVALDGAQGLVRVLEAIGAAGRACTDTDIALLVEDAIEVSGADAVRTAVQEAAAGSSNIAAALVPAGYTPQSLVEEVVHWRKTHHQRLRPGLDPNTTWEQIKETLAEKCLRWPQVASDAEFLKAAKDLDPQDDPERLHSHVRLFWKRAFPLDPQPIIDLATHPDERVAVAALSALENIRHPNVRDLFDRLRCDDKWSDRAVGLLISNYETGDAATIMEMLEAEPDPDSLHIMAIDARQVFESNPAPEGLDVLMLAYEKTPCSLCRHSCLESIEKLGRVPDWMIQECLYDCDSGTRETAERLASSQPTA